MEVHFKPETETRLYDLVDTLYKRYEEIISGKVKPISGEEFFESLRRREDDLVRDQNA